MPSPAEPCADVSRWHWHSGTGPLEWLSLENLKPHTWADLSSHFLTWKLWLCLMEQLEKKKSSTSLKKRLKWRTLWIKTSHFKPKGVKKSWLLCGLKHTSSSDTCWDHQTIVGTEWDPHSDFEALNYLCLWRVIFAQEPLVPHAFTHKDYWRICWGLPSLC